MKSHHQTLIVLFFVALSTIPSLVFAQTGTPCTGNGQGSCNSGFICTVSGEGSNTCQPGIGGGPNTGGGTTITGGPNTGGPSVTLINPLGTGATLNSFLVSILGLVVKIGSIVVILMLVYVGFMFVTARGEPGKLTTARQALLWTVVGALILLGAQAIAMGIQATVQALSTGT